MNLQQLEYILALDKIRNFAKAADSCFITQPALTIQIKKLEEEVGAVLFDRTKKPVVPTEVGKEIIDQARIILDETKKIKDIVQNKKEKISGELKLGIIPTVSPYLTPLFATEFGIKYKSVNITIKEIITEEIIHELKEGNIDAGIVVTPFEINDMKCIPLFNEKFFAYISPNNQYYKKEKLKTSDLDLNEIWILKEGNCFRNQVINICGKSSLNNQSNNFNYESFSIDSLKRIVESQNGLTIIPQLAALEVDKRKSKMIKSFYGKVPHREVSLIINRTFMKKNIIDKLVEEIKFNLPEEIKNNNSKNLIDTKISK